MRIVAYSDNLKNKVISFLQRMWLELGRTWDSTGRENEFFNIANEYQSDRGEFWVVLNEENEVIGTVALKSLTQYECELARLYLDPAYRGKGVGRELMQLAINKAKEMGYKKIKLDTSKKLTRAYALNKKMGFRETKSYDDENQTVFMELDLNEGVIA